MTGHFFQTELTYTSLVKLSSVPGLRCALERLHFNTQYIPDFYLAKPVTVILRSVQPGSTWITYTPEMDESFTLL